MAAAESVTEEMEGNQPAGADVASPTMATPVGAEVAAAAFATPLMQPTTAAPLEDSMSS